MAEITEVETKGKEHEITHGALFLPIKSVDGFMVEGENNSAKSRGKSTPRKKEKSFEKMVDLTVIT